MAFVLGKPSNYEFMVPEVATRGQDDLNFAAIMHGLDVPLLNTENRALSHLDWRHFTYDYVACRDVYEPYQQHLKRP